MFGRVLNIVHWKREIVWTHTSAQPYFLILVKENIARVGICQLISPKFPTRIIDRNQFELGGHFGELSVFLKNVRSETNTTKTPLTNSADSTRDP